LWFRILSLAPISIVYPMQSMAYILVILLAWLFFGENIPWTRWFGGFVIIIGVYFVSLK
jgi:drug/metabolite transporter (DMT)-like permease